MSIQWTIIASFLYVEIGVVLILLLPFISPKRWARLFKSRFLNAISNQSLIYFSVFMFVLLLFFLDAIREMRKYTNEVEKEGSHDHSHLSSELQVHMKLFRAQRNFYISGFALFLWLVLRRIATLISAQATLLAANEASMKQAQSATDAAQKLLDERDRREADEGADNSDNASKEIRDKEITRLTNELEETTAKLRSANIDLDALKKQSKSLADEYDRLTEEHSKLQNAERNRKED